MKEGNRPQEPGFKPDVGLLKPLSNEEGSEGDHKGAIYAKANTVATDGWSLHTVRDQIQ